MALSIATGVIKAILVMIFTPFLARFMRLDNPQAAMVFGGLAGTVSGVRLVSPPLIADWCLTEPWLRHSIPGLVVLWARPFCS